MICTCKLAILPIHGGYIPVRFAKIYLRPLHYCRPSCWWKAATSSSPPTPSDRYTDLFLPSATRLPAFAEHWTHDMDRCGYTGESMHSYHKRGHFKISCTVGRPTAFVSAGGCLQEVNWFKTQYSSWFSDNSVLSGVLSSNLFGCTYLAFLAPHPPPSSPPTTLPHPLSPALIHISAKMF